MMCDIKKRSGFGKLVNYANNPKKAILIDLKDVRDDNNSTIAASMQGQADDKPGRKLEKPVYHISLNFSKEDAPKLSNELMVEIASEFMEKMGIRNTQYIVCRHTDTEHPHMHIVANRVDNDGNTISDRNDIHRGIKICREITKKYGLHMAEGKKNVKRNRLNGRDNAKYFIYDSLNKYISKNMAWKGLERKLDEEGIEMKFHFDEKTGFVNGVSFSYDGHTFSGSKIDKEMSFQAIDRRLIFSINSSIYNNLRAEMSGISIIKEPIAGSNSKDFIEEKSENSRIYPLKFDDENDKSKGGSDDNSITQSTSSDGDADNSDMAKTALEVASELILQPHQPPLSSGGGGGNDNGNWGDEDKKKRRSSRRR